MVYTPTGWFCTKHRLRLMLSECATVRKVMLAADADEALAKIATYSAQTREYDSEGNLLPPKFAFPRILLHEDAVAAETDETGRLMGISERTLGIWIALYVPADVEGVETITDEEAWVREQFSNINTELLNLVGTGEPVAGETHLVLTDPVFRGVERESEDERGDGDLDPYPELARWFGMLEYEVH